MSHGLITRDWADGTYSFRLGFGEWLELEPATGLGPLELYTALVSRKWRVQQLRETVRLGLIGGGCNPVTALKLVRRYVEERPLLESVPLALEIVAAAITIPEGQTIPGEAEAAETSQAGSISPPSMETVQ